jgi:hypothetical protein
MKGHLSYTALLDAIGFAVEQAKGADVLVHELPAHILVSFVTPTEQQVVRWTRAEIVALHATATTADAEARTRHGALARFHGRRRAPNPASVRRRLRALGQYLDGRAARALVLQEHAGGCYVAYTGLEMESRAMDVMRITEMLDAAHVAALVARSEAS